MAITAISPPSRLSDEIFSINLVGDYPNYECTTPNNDIKEAFLSQKILQCDCFLSEYGSSITLPLVTGNVADSVWIFSNTIKVFTSMGGGYTRAFNFTVSIHEGGIVKAIKEYIDGTVSYMDPQTLTDSQKQQARENINAPAPYTAGQNISISDNVIATKAFPCNPNIFDNPDYAVNQRGITSLPSVSGYYADRWRKYGVAATGNVTRGKVHLASDGTTTCGWQQRMEADRLIAGMTYTMSFLVKPISIDDLTEIRLSYGAALDTISGSIALPANTPLNARTVFSYTFTLPESSDGFYNFRIRARNVPCEFEIGPGKLELGAQQTLAHQDADGNWVLNEIPSYAEQVSRCQRYLVRLSSHQCPASILGTNEILFFVPLPVTMRAQPTIQQNDFQVLNKNGVVQTGFTFSVSSLRSNGVIIRAIKTGHKMTDAVLSAGTLSLLSAEL